MRFVTAMLLALSFLGAGAMLTPVTAKSATSADSDFVIALQQQPSGRVDVDVDVNRGGRAWWTSPTWIAIGVIALVLIILIVALVSRGGGTTVIKE
jgi:hypothetical protein